jgi:hypothetical protein
MPLSEADTQDLQPAFKSKTWMLMAGRSAFTLSPQHWLLDCTTMRVYELLTYTLLTEQVREALQHNRVYNDSGVIAVDDTSHLWTLACTQGQQLPAYP